MLIVLAYFSIVKSKSALILDHFQLDGASILWSHKVTTNSKTLHPLAIKQQPFCKYRVNREIWLNAVVSPEKREEKTRLAVTKKRRSRHDLSSSKLLFRKPQVLVIIGQLFRRKQKAKTDHFSPCLSKDHQDFFVTAWSPPSLLDKVSKLQTKFVVHCNKTIKKRYFLLQHWGNRFYRYCYLGLKTLRTRKGQENHPSKANPSLFLSVTHRHLHWVPWSSQEYVTWMWSCNPILQ